jgi:hypothetical protein
MTRGFLGVKKIIVPSAAVAETQAHLAAMGEYECEGFVLWVGTRDEATFHVVEAIIPAQRALKSLDGVCITIDSDELFRLNRYLYERGFQIIAQIHSHPTDAYHSETDDTYPVATTVGALSLVVPDFARHKFHLSHCAVFRLIPGSGWCELERSSVSQLIHIVEAV